MSNSSSVPKNWKEVLDEEKISKAISRISYEILEKNTKLDKLAIVGIKTGGDHIAKRILKKIKRIENVDLLYGAVDITLYRDDLVHEDTSPDVKGTELPFKIGGTKIILVDDVLYTGRTVRAALDAISDFGRPRSVELAVMVDRGHRELPISPDYIGKNIPTNRKDFVRLRLKEEGYKDGLYLIESK